MSSDDTIWLIGVLPEPKMHCKVTPYTLQKILVEGLGVNSTQLRVFLDPLTTALNLNARREAELNEVANFLNSTAFLKLSSNVKPTQLVENRDTTTNVRLIKSALFLHSIGKLT